MKFKLIGIGNGEYSVMLLDKPIAIMSRTMLDTRIEYKQQMIGVLGSSVESINAALRILEVRIEGRTDEKPRYEIETDFGNMLRFYVQIGDVCDKIRAECIKAAKKGLDHCTYVVEKEDEQKIRETFHDLTLTFEDYLLTLSW